ncbi:MAG: hypothetical protein ACI835_001928 [Planctomycetota bacterium]|jgi:hypothetical protein
MGGRKKGKDESARMRRIHRHAYILAWLGAHLCEFPSYRIHNTLARLPLRILRRLVAWGIIETSIENPTTESTSDQQAKSSKGRKRLLITAIAITVGALFPEIALRYLLFSDQALARDLGEKLRQPSLYTKGVSDADYWKLMYRFGNSSTKKPAKLYDPDLGWIRPGIDPETYANAQHATLAGRRPVLLYGASFAHCVTQREDCFAALLEHSDLKDDLALINYGVGGYGFGQMYLMYKRTIGLFEGLDPIVIFAPVIQSDLDRIMVDFRSWPKPKFRIHNGRLSVLSDLTPSGDEYIAQNGVELKSYAWRYLINGSNFLPPSWKSKLLGKSALHDSQRLVVASVVQNIDRMAEELGHECFFMFFHSHTWLAKDKGQAWQEEHLIRNLSRVGLPWVDTRRPLLAASETNEVPVANYYIMHGLGRNHLNADGNALALEALEKGLTGEFEQVVGE